MWKHKAGNSNYGQMSDIKEVDSMLQVVGFKCFNQNKSSKIRNVLLRDFLRGIILPHNFK